MEHTPLHVRQIKIEAFDLGENKMLVVGRLDDTRSSDFHTIHGRVFPAGVIHDMSLELEVSLPDFTITAARTMMPQVPQDGCRDVIPGVQALVGLRVAGGFTGEVKRRLGGSRGCAHLVSLILAMAPVVVQGASANLQEQPAEDRAAVANSHLINSCYMWREGGPIVQSMKEQAMVTKNGSDDGH